MKDSRLLGVVWLVALCTDPALAVFDMDLFEMLGSKIMARQPFDQDPLDCFKRQPAEIGTCPDKVFDKDCFTKEKNDTVLESLAVVPLVAAGGEAEQGGDADPEFRGSDRDLQENPPSLQAGSSSSYPTAKLKDAPEGCGNPVCVLVDKKPMRFNSMCHLQAYLSAKNMLKSMHFVQKGDCMDVISKKSDELKWINGEKDKDLDCTACAESRYCKKSVVLNIDLSNIFYGKSSAPEIKRMSGVAVQFENICKAMNFFKKKENLNEKTNVIGILFGTIDDIIPINNADQQCLWTEWFDTDEACNSDFDLESLTAHLSFERTKIHTSAMTICPPENIRDYEVRGGSTISNSPIKFFEDPAYASTLNVNFTLDVTYKEYMARCENSRQGGNRLGPPYLHKSQKTDDGTILYDDQCVDLQVRYCCSSIKMYRPIDIDDFSSLLGFRFPIGAFVVTDIKMDDEGQYLRIEANSFRISFVSAVGEHSMQTLIFNLEQVDISDIFSAEEQANFGDDTKVAVIQGKIVAENGENSKDFGGIVIMTKLPDGTLKVTVDMTANGKKIAKLDIIIGTDDIHDDEEHTDMAHIISIEGTTFRTDENDRPIRDEIFTVTVKKLEDPDKKYLTVTEIRTPENELIRKIEVTVRKCITYDSSLIDVGSIIIDKTPTEFLDNYVKDKTFIEHLEDLKKEIILNYLIESPPVDDLFFECEWRDWISLDYPGRARYGDFELKALGYGTEYEKHVCGDEPRNSLFIDVVDRETLTPWYEMMFEHEGQLRPKEHYKITPYFGYACNDLNALDGKGCSDMKVRYCCAKKKVSSWSPWEQWGVCSHPCGGGKQIRERALKKCKGCEKTLDDTDERQTTDKRTCNVQSCPVDFQWTEWTPWSECTVSCNAGTKERHRDCLPALNGGERCPEKDEEPDLYTQVEKCTMSDCDEYVYTVWTSWSQCSTSCGLGQKIRKRSCRNERTLQHVKDSYCLHYSGQMTSVVEQSDGCKLSDCPVNGGWSVWTEYGSCTQDCRTEGSTTRAHRKRYQFCTNPMPKGSGADCVIDEDDDSLSFNPDNKAKVQSSPCDSNLPLCPEDCIMSEWSNWSSCSANCIKRGEPRIFGGKDQDQEHWEEDNYDNMFVTFKDIVYEENYPKKTRQRFLLMPAKNGGKCGYVDDFCDDENCPYPIIKDKEGKKINYFQETLPCTLWEQHDITRKDTPNLYSELPGHEYDNSTHIVGFCPIDCEWRPWVITHDCKKQQEISEPTGQGCYMSETMDYIQTFKHNKKYEDAFLKVQELLKELEANPELIDPEQANELPKFKDKCLNKNTYRRCRRNQRKKYGILRSHWESDLAKFYSLTVQERERYAKLPNMEGLFGGAACKTKDGKELTRNEEEEDEKHYGYVEMTTSYCSFAICPYKIIRDNQPGGGNTTNEPDPVLPICFTGAWSKWSKWGECEPCSTSTERYRTTNRECVNPCEDVKYEKECRPGTDERDRTVTTVKSELCNPCPPEYYATWGSWGPWSMESKTCGDEDFVKKRERSCMKSGEVVMECLQDDIYFPSKDNSSGLVLLDRNVEIQVYRPVKCGAPTLVGNENDEAPTLVTNDGNAEFKDDQDRDIPSLITEYSEEYLI